jgi:hypothetical protein
MAWFITKGTIKFFRLDIPIVPLIFGHTFNPFSPYGSLGLILALDPFIAFHLGFPQLQL